MCFARIRFRHCQITLPLFERDWQSLKLVLRQNSLRDPCSLPLLDCQQDSSPGRSKGKPYLPVQSVLAAAFI
jgi:hypothetical protein